MLSATVTEKRWPKYAENSKRISNIDKKIKNDLDALESLRPIREHEQMASSTRHMVMDAWLKDFVFTEVISKNEAVKYLHAVMTDC